MKPSSIVCSLVFYQTLLAAAPPPYSPENAQSACAQSDTVNIAPAVMLDMLDKFRDGLPAQDHDRLDAAPPRNANGGIAECDNIDSSRASCEAAAYMPALRSTGLMPRFLETICPHVPNTNGGNQVLRPKS